MEVWGIQFPGKYTFIRRCLLPSWKTLERESANFDEIGGAAGEANPMRGGNPRGQGTGGSRNQNRQTKYRYTGISISTFFFGRFFDTFLLPVWIMPLENSGKPRITLTK